MPYEGASGFGKKLSVFRVLGFQKCRPLIMKQYYHYLIDEETGTQKVCNFSKISRVGGEGQFRPQSSLTSEPRLLSTLSYGFFVHGLGLGLDCLGLLGAGGGHTLHFQHTSSQGTWYQIPAEPCWYVRESGNINTSHPWTTGRLTCLKTKVWSYISWPWTRNTRAHRALWTRLHLLWIPWKDLDKGEILKSLRCKYGQWDWWICTWDLRKYWRKKTTRAVYHTHPMCQILC